jgi:phage FluMu protein Com
MLEVQVTLDFDCCGCGHLVSVTLRCTGKGLLEGARTVAAVHVPCPTCGVVNQLYFEPSGRVRAVEPCGARALPEPSLN